MPPVVTPDQRQGREAACREIVRDVEHGMTVTQARRRCSVSMHRSTAYRLPKRVEREGEDALVERRHGHPIKLRGEVLAFVLDYCQGRASAASCEVQRCISEQFGIAVSVSQRESRARRSRAEPPDNPARKKSRKQASPLPLDRMNRQGACSCWQPRLKRGS